MQEKEAEKHMSSLVRFCCRTVLIVGYVEKRYEFHIRDCPKYKIHENAFNSSRGFASRLRDAG